MSAPPRRPSAPGRQSRGRRASRGRPRSGGTRTASVQALERGLRLLKVLAGADGMTLTALARASGLAASTTHRLLATLSAHRVVMQDEQDQSWMIGVEAFRLGQAFQRRLSLATVGRPVMRALMESTGETANMGILDGGDVIFVAQVESQEPVRAFFRAGERRHAHACGIGKALLAELPREQLQRLLRERGLPRFTEATLTQPDRLRAELEQSRQRGWAFDNEERSRGVRCLAAPIFDVNGEAVAGLSISGPSDRIHLERLDLLGRTVRRAADAITRALGGQPRAR